MLFIPYRVDVSNDRYPFVNQLLVISILAVFLILFLSSDFTEGQTIFSFRLEEACTESISTYVLNGWEWRGLLGHMWLHGDIFHLGGNLLFLWIFGNAVCGRIGNFLYLPVYLVMGILAATTHLCFSGNPAIGASGAINGIIGLFLVYYWDHEVDCILLFGFRIRIFSLSSFWIIGMWVLFDIFGVVTSGEGIAYFAHLGGFTAGVLTGLILSRLEEAGLLGNEGSLPERIRAWLQDRQDARLEAIARDEVDKRLAEGTVRRPVSAAEAEAGPGRAPEMVQFRCPCGKLIKAPVHLAGRKGRCPQCRQEVIVPEPEGLPPVIN